ncbi:MAG: Mut7-C RNAse domain-containing protein [Acidobacteriota bacterium]
MDEVRFACDAMLGTLARWLRFAGFDTLFEPGIADPVLVATSRAEGRWLLTRDRRLAAHAGPRSVLLRQTALDAQVQEVRARLPIEVDPGRYLSRCPRCNHPLEAVGAESVREIVPPYVATHATAFRRCPGCGRCYWRGTHVRRIERRLGELLAEPGAGGGPDVTGR